MMFGFIRKIFAPSIVISSKADIKAFRTLIEANNKKAHERTPKDRATLHQLTLTQMRHGSQADREMAESIESAKQTAADFIRRALREASKRNPNPSDLHTGLTAGA